jgi:hypothetical protein
MQDINRPTARGAFQARPRLFATLCWIFVIWIAALLALYFLTVYPRRHSAHPALLTPATSLP